MCLIGIFCAKLVMANIVQKYEELHIKINSKSNIYYELDLHFLLNKLKDL